MHVLLFIESLPRYGDFHMASLDNIPLAETTKQFEIVVSFIDDISWLDCIKFKIDPLIKT